MYRFRTKFFFNTHTYAPGLRHSPLVGVSTIDISRYLSPAHTEILSDVKNAIGRVVGNG